MLTANDAYNKTKNNIENFLTAELRSVGSKIEAAIEKGKFSISGDGTLSKEAINALTNFGYKVYTGSQKNESYYCISWELK